MPELQPFRPHDESLSLWGDFQLTDAGIEIRFRLEDPKKVVRHAPAENRWCEEEVQRADGLWQDTCFEAFFGVPGASAYWEVNVASDGRWNLYRFDDYRKPQPPTASHDFELESLLTAEGSLALLLRPRGAESMAARLAALPAALDVSLTAVLKTEKHTHYYSTKHAGAKADFHLRAGFIIRRKT